MYAGYVFLVMVSYKTCANNILVTKYSAITFSSPISFFCVIVIICFFVFSFPLVTIVFVVVVIVGVVVVEVYALVFAVVEVGDGVMVVGIVVADAVVVVAVVNLLVVDLCLVVARNDYIELVIHNLDD